MKGNLGVEGPGRHRHVDRHPHHQHHHEDVKVSCRQHDASDHRSPRVDPRLSATFMNRVGIGDQADLRASSEVSSPLMLGSEHLADGDRAVYGTPDKVRARRAEGRRLFAQDRLGEPGASAHREDQLRDQRRIDAGQRADAMGTAIVG